MIVPTGYSVVDYGCMVQCEPRTSVYAEALRRSITPGCKVIDLGAAFGIFSLLACKYGAGEVVAIEPDPAIELLMPLARANGFADRITIINDISTNYNPEIKADVIVSDCRGAVPLYQNHIGTLVDARARLLAPGGTLLPMRDILRIALAQWPRSHKATTQPWLNNEFGLDMSLGHRFAANTADKAYLKPRALISQTQELAVLDYRSIAEPNLDKSVELTATRSGRVDGLLIWFDAEITDGLKYSNAPGQPELVYGQWFMPLSGTPTLRAGDRIAARVRATLVDGEYIWNWDWKKQSAASGAYGELIQQSTFLSRIHSPKLLAPASNQHVPQCDIQMTLDRNCLSLVGEGKSLGQIAQTLHERFPEQLQSYKAALDHAARCLSRYAN